MRDLIKNLPGSRTPVLFSYSHLEKLHSFCRQHSHSEFLELLSLTGYAAVRNLTLVTANLVNADIMVSLDDDEIIADDNYLARITDDFEKLDKDYDVFRVGRPLRKPAGGNSGG